MMMTRRINDIIMVIVSIISIAFIAFAIAVILSGCAIISEDQWTKYRVDMYKQKSVYPKCSSNEKALILAKEMKNDRNPVSIVRKYYKVEVIYLYQDGRQIWPANEK